MRDFDFWLEALGEPTKWGKRSEGNRDASWPCPMGEGDPASTSLHVTEKAGHDALVKDFAHDHSKSELVEYIAGQEREEQPVSLPAPRPSRGGARKTSGERKTGSGLPDTRGVRPSPASTIADPLAWYADYCGVPLDWMKAEIPVRVSKDGWLAHYWDTARVTKDRKPGTGERRWTPKGALAPGLWPTVPDEMPKEVWLCEGETDCIVLRRLGLPAFTSGGASDIPEQYELRAMMARGVERIVVAYDADSAGRQGAEKLVKAAREAGLGVTLATLADPLLGGPKDWRERMQTDTSMPETEAADWAQHVWRMDEVPEAEDETLLLGRLDPYDHTILFGDGGVGKGVLAAWWVALLTNPRTLDHPHRPAADLHGGKHVLILDYEAHATTEWSKRLRRFDAAMDRVFIVQPDRPIWDFAATVREMIRGLDIDYVVVDSALYACAGADPYSPEGATNYSLAIAQFQRPVLTLGHVTKSRENRDKPFGSVFWHNGARLTVSIEAKGVDDPREVQTQKASHGGAFAVAFDWDWVNTTGLPKCLDERPMKLTVEDGILIALAQGPATLDELANRMKASKTDRGTISITLGRMKKEGTVTLTGKTWDLGT